MAWTVEFTPRAAKAIQKLDATQQKRVLRFIEEVAELDNPRDRGKALTGGLTGLWRWRVGDYRIIAEVADERVVILVLDVGHRSKIYEA